MKNTPGRCEALFDINATDKVIVGDKTRTMKDYPVELKTEDRKLFAVVEQGSGNMKKNFLVIATPKLKVASRK